MPTKEITLTKEKNTTPTWFKIAVPALAMIIAIIGGLIYLEESKEGFKDTQTLIAGNEEAKFPLLPEDGEVGENSNKLDQTITFNEDLESADGTYFIKQPVIQEQQAYIAYPTEIDPSDLPTLIIYSHGSITYVTENLEDEFMLKLKEYADYFTSRNYAFAASNEHGQNWGNADSIQDMTLLRDWIANQYPIQEKVNLVGFSMGGLPTMNYTLQYPETVNKIALLAPTTLSSEWGTQEKIDSLANIDIKIWHGEKDVNIGIINSENFVNTAKSLGKEIKLVRIPNETHFDMDTEKIPEIYDYFSVILGR